MQIENKTLDSLVHWPPMPLLIEQAVKSQSRPCPSLGWREGSLRDQNRGSATQQHVRGPCFCWLPGIWPANDGSTSPMQRLQLHLASFHQHSLPFWDSIKIKFYRHELFKLIGDIQMNQADRQRIRSLCQEMELCSGSTKSVTLLGKTTNY